MHRKVFLALAVVCCLSTAAYAVPTVTAGDWVFTEGTLGNIAAVTVAGGDSVNGLNFRVGVGDESSAGQPLIESIDIVGPGTIFNGNNTGQVNAIFVAPGYKTNSTTTTAAGFVTAAGDLGYVSISTVGVAPGVYSFHLTLTSAPLPTNLVIPTNLVDGTITVVPVPEPTSIVLGLFAAGGLCAVAIRRHRRKA